MDRMSRTHKEYEWHKCQYVIYVKPVPLICPLSMLSTHYLYLFIQNRKDIIIIKKGSDTLIEAINLVISIINLVALAYFTSICMQLINNKEVKEPKQKRYFLRNYDVEEEAVVPDEIKSAKKVLEEYERGR